MFLLRLKLDLKHPTFDLLTQKMDMKTVDMNMLEKTMIWIAMIYATGDMHRVRPPVDSVQLV